MPQGRPEIPIEVKREILFQARHRCAVCCEPLGIEFAHVVPWHKTQDNSAENLIALCAVCHERADKEHWGTAQLARYKKEPCALQRSRLPPLSAPQKALIDLIIDADPETMTEKECLRLVYMLAAYLGLSTADVKFVSAGPANSTRVRLELPAEAAAKLLTGLRTHDPLLKAFLEPFEASSPVTAPAHGVPLRLYVPLLAEFSLGRILLHLFALVRRPRYIAWHFRCIVEDILRPQEPTYGPHAKTLTTPHPHD